MNELNLKMRTANVKAQEDFYEDSKGNSLKATYKKDENGMIDIYNIEYQLSGKKVNTTWTGDREYILENTNHASHYSFSTDAIYAEDLKAETLPKGSIALYKQLEEMREGAYNEEKR